MHTERQTASGVPKGYKKTYIFQIMEKSGKPEKLFLPQLSQNVEHRGRFSGRLVFCDTADRLKLQYVHDDVKTPLSPWCCDTDDTSLMMDLIQTVKL